MKNNLTFSDALDELQKVMDKDTKYQKECIALLDDLRARQAPQDKDTEYQDECDVLLDVEGNPVPDKYASITSDNADYFEQQQDEE